MIATREWQAGPRRPRLPPDDVHVWWAPLDPSPALVERLAESLSADERARAERFVFDRDRRRFLVGRGVLRRLLGRYLHEAPARLEFRYETRGKPALAGRHAGGLAFNLANSHEVALYAVACGRRVGIDVEWLRPVRDADAIAERCFSARERDTFAALPPAVRPEAFFHCWTRKEAYIKAIGEGLACPLDSFDVTLTPGEPARLLRIEGEPEAPSRWSLHPLAPVAGYVAALALEGHGRLACWKWTEGGEEAAA